MMTRYISLMLMIPWAFLAAASEPGEILKEHVIAESQAGRNVTLAVRIGLPDPVPARITRANATGVALNAQGLTVDLSWTKLEQQDLYELYRPMIAQSPAPVCAAYLRVGLRSGRQREKGFNRTVRRGCGDSFDVGFHGFAIVHHRRPIHHSWLNDFRTRKELPNGTGDDYCK